MIMYDAGLHDGRSRDSEGCGGTERDDEGLAEHKEEGALGAARVHRRYEKQDLSVPCSVAAHHAAVDGRAQHAPLCTADRFVAVSSKSWHHRPAAAVASSRVPLSLPFSLSLSPDRITIVFSSSPDAITFHHRFFFSCYCVHVHVRVIRESLMSVSMLTYHGHNFFEFVFTLRLSDLGQVSVARCELLGIYMHR